jgi:Ca-activated chloride channel family protein
MRAFLGLAFAALAFPSLAAAEGKSIIVLDASGSMWGQIDGRAKLEIAREALGSVLSGMDPATEMGLMAYGHRSKGDCADIELVVPPGPGTAQAITDAANAMKFLGKTPLSDAVKMAAGELKFTEEAATVILITDGIETCSADPCALGSELEAAGVNFTAHVVGFGLTKEEGQAVACLAENTGGKYIEAADAGSLVEALKTTVVVAPEPEPVPEPAPEPAAPEFNFIPRLFFAAGGDEVPADLGAAWEIHLINGDNTLGERVTTEYGSPKINLDPGTYRVVTKLYEASAETDVTITADAVAAPDVVLNAGTLIVRPRGSDGGPIETGAAVALLKGEENLTTYYGETKTYLPAGDWNVDVTVGLATARQPVTIIAGQTTEIDVIAAAGLAAIEGYYTEGMLMEDSGHAVTILSAKQALDGSRERLTTAYGMGTQFTLAPGDYIALVELGLAAGESAFTVKPGERVDVPVILNAGVLAVKAAGATSVEVYAGKVKIDGSRERLTTEYTEDMNLTAAAGDYLVVVYRGDVKAEATVTVKAGERSEVTVP